MRVIISTGTNTKQRIYGTKLHSVVRILSIGSTKKYFVTSEEVF